MPIDGVDLTQDTTHFDVKCKITEFYHRENGSTTVVVKK